MAGETSGASGPRSLHTLVHDATAGSTLPLTVELDEIRTSASARVLEAALKKTSWNRTHDEKVALTPAQTAALEAEQSYLRRAEILIDWDGDVVRIEVRRLEDDPQVEVVLR